MGSLSFSNLKRASKIHKERISFLSLLLMSNLSTYAHFHTCVCVCVYYHYECAKPKRPMIYYIIINKYTNARLSQTKDCQAFAINRPANNTNQSNTQRALGSSLICTYFVSPFAPFTR